MTVPVSTLTVALMNRSTIPVAAADLNPLAAALLHQAVYHLAPVWGLTQTIHVLPVPLSTVPPKGAWQLILLDDADQAGVLGYHDLTTDGQPLGKVFVRTDLTYGADYHVTTSHEMCEMLIDPWINLAAQVNNTTFYAYEVADPCEADQFGYVSPNGLKVSDFVTPAWFSGEAGPYDFKKHIARAGQILPGGFIGALSIPNGQGWVQITNAEDRDGQFLSRAPVGSRRERRRIGRQNWIRSTAE